MQKVRTAFAIGAIAALALAGCGTPAPSETQAPNAPGPEALEGLEDAVEISFWHSLADVSGTTVQELVDDFNAENEGSIHVTASYQGSNVDSLAKYRASTLDQSTPSVILSYDISTGYLNDVGQTVSASDLAAANPDDLDLAEIRPVAANYYSADGELLAVPFSVSMPLLYVNTVLLKQAGITDLSSLRTLEGVAAAAEKVAQAVPGTKGLVQPFDGWWFEQLTAGSGSTYCSPDNGREGEDVTALELSPDARAAITTVSDLYTGGSGLDTGLKGGDASNAFIAGKVAMLLNSSGAAGVIRGAAPFQYQVLPYPTSGDPESSGPVIGGAALWVSKEGHTDAEQVASWRFISYLLSAAVQERFTQATGFAPVNLNVDDSATQKDFLVTHPDATVIANQFNSVPAVTATAGCLSGALPAIRNAVVPHMQAAFAGAVPIEEALDAAETDANKAIDEYLEQAGK